MTYEREIKITRNTNKSEWRWHIGASESKKYKEGDNFIQYRSGTAKTFSDAMEKVNAALVAIENQLNEAMQ